MTEIQTSDKTVGFRHLLYMWQSGAGRGEALGSHKTSGGEYHILLLPEKNPSTGAVLNGCA